MGTTSPEILADQIREIFSELDYTTALVAASDLLRKWRDEAITLSKKQV